MRLVAWNCNKGPYDKKVTRLDSLNRDIVVIQECPKPLVESEGCLWFGDNLKQGVTVLAARAPFRLRRLPVLEDVPKFVVPIQVLGPIHFRALCGQRNESKSFSHRLLRPAGRVGETDHQR